MNIEKRNIAKCIILSIVTCGIYEIYWIVKVAKEAVSVKDANDDGTLEVVLMLLLPFVGVYLAEKKLYEGASNMGLPISDNSVVYIIVALFGFWIVDLALMQNDLNKIADFTSAPHAGGYYDATGAAPQNGFDQNNNQQS